MRQTQNTAIALHGRLAGALLLVVRLRQGLVGVPSMRRVRGALLGLEGLGRAERKVEEAREADLQAGCSTAN